VTVYVETVFGLPGIGGLTLRALNVSSIQGFDLPLILGIILFTGVIVILVNLLADVVQVLMNPQLRT
jgi:peptide/nickel transport system permease protein